MFRGSLACSLCDDEFFREFSDPEIFELGMITGQFSSSATGGYGRRLAMLDVEDLTEPAD